MKKFFTVLGCGLVLGSFAFTANAQINTVQWGQPFTPSGEEIYAIPEYVGDIYVVTNSETDITFESSDWGDYSNSIPFMFWNDWDMGDYACSQTYDEMYVNAESHYVYSFNLQEYCSWPDDVKAKYGIKWEEGGVQFTVFQGKYTEGGSTEPDKDIITENVPFTISTDAPKWYYTPKAYQPYFYFQSDSETDILSNLKFYFDMGGDDLERTLKAEKGEDGFYSFVGTTSLGEGNTYYLQYTGTEEVNLTLVLDSYYPAEEIGWGVSFKAGPDSGQRFTYKFSEAYSNVSYIQVSTSTNVLQDGTLTVTNLSNENVLGGWRSSNTYPMIEGPEGYWGYTGSLSFMPENIINITYTGTEEIEIQIGKGEYTENGVPSYMPAADYSPKTISESDVTAGIDITWGEEVTYRGSDDATINIFFGESIDPSTIECRDYLVFLSDEAGEPDMGLSTRAIEADESGETVTLLFGGALNNTLDVGVYRIVIPEGLFVNSKGALNDQETLYITVVSPTVGAVSPVEGTEFEGGEDVVFTVSFDGKAEANNSIENPVYVTDYNDVDEGGYELKLNWSPNVLYINEEGQIVINLGNDMPAGTYFLSLLAGAVTINGTENEEIADFRFVVNESAEDPTLNYLSVYPTVTPDPKADSLEPFSQISLAWTGYTVQRNSEAAKATFAGNEIIGSVVNNTLVFPTNVKESGTYSLVVPAQYIVATDSTGAEYYNTALNLVFVVVADDENNNPSAVDRISVDLQDGVIYNLNGVRVDANKLTKGIYIINGKKVVVR